MLSLTAGLTWFESLKASGMLFVYSTLAFFLIFLCICVFFTFRRALHIYQLSSYQNPSYRRYLREHRGETYGLRRVVLLASLPVVLLPVPWAVPLLTALCIAFVFLNRPQDAKKPLVYTARAKRLFATDWLVTLLLFAGAAALLLSLPAPWGSVCFMLALCLLVLAQPYLIMLAALFNQPIEKGIASRYINDARRRLENMPNLKIIGITGSYGKTSTKYFLSELLSVKFNVYMTPGNFNTTLGVTRAIREGLLPTHEVFLCEMGARHVHDIREICELVHPDYGVLTSVGPQHLETFGSIENIVNTKFELYDAVMAKGGAAFLNFDSELIAEHAAQLCADNAGSPAGRAGGQARTITYGTGDGLDYTARDIVINGGGSSFTVTAPNGESQGFKTQLLGRANVQNLLAAIAVSHTLGISLRALAPAVRALQSVPHRLQLVRGGDFAIIDDAYNANPAGARVALDTLAMCAGTRILATPGMVELGEKQESENRTLGAYAASRCDYAVLIGERQAVPLQAGLRDAGFPEERIYVARDLNDGLGYIRGLPGGGQDKMVLLLNDLPDNY